MKHPVRFLQILIEIINVVDNLQTADVSHTLGSEEMIDDFRLEISVKVAVEAEFVVKLNGVKHVPFPTASGFRNIPFVSYDISGGFTPKFVGFLAPGEEMW
jgi:hypothetical protein